MSTAPALKRGIRFRDLTLFYVAGLLSIRWSASAAAAGPSSLIVWIAALVCFFIPLAGCVMELSSRYPAEGGLYVWTQRAFGDGCGFLAAWTYWMSNLPYFPGVLYFGAASALFAFGDRGRALAANPLYFMLFACSVLALITLLNIRGVNAGKWLNNVSAFGGILPLCLLIVLAALSWSRFGSATHFSASTMSLHWSMKNAIFWSTIFFAFVGIEAGSFMGDEIENPRRVIPLAILAGGTIATVGYICGTGALLVALPSDAVSGPDGIMNGLHALTSRLGLEWLLPIAALLVALNAIAGASAFLSSTSRLPFVAGIDHYLPPIFGSVHPRYQTPWVSIGAYGVAGIIVALLGQAGTTVHGAYDVLVSMAVLITFLPFVFIFTSMIRLQSEPAGPEVRRVPGGKPVAIVLGVLGLLSTLVTIGLSAIPADDEPNKPLAVLKVVGGTFVMVAAGIGVYLVGRYKGRRARAAQQQTSA
ncbi:MAG TPA: APC family permease [Candidatus Solibacter sp.]